MNTGSRALVRLSLIVVVSSVFLLKPQAMIGGDSLLASTLEAVATTGGDLAARQAGVSLESPSGGVDEEGSGEQEEAADLLEHGTTAAGTLLVPAPYSSFVWFVPRSTFRPPRQTRLA